MLHEKWWLLFTLDRNWCVFDNKAIQISIFIFINLQRIKEVFTIYFSFRRLTNLLIAQPSVKPSTGAAVVTSVILALNACDSATLKFPNLSYEAGKVTSILAAKSFLLLPISIPLMSDCSSTIMFKYIFGDHLFQVQS